MVENLIIIVSLLLAFVTGFFCAFKSLQFGLRWKIQVENKQPPTINNPIKEILKAKEEVKVKQEEIVQQRYAAEQLSEYLYGEDGDF